MKPIEHILAVPTATLNQVGSFQGFKSQKDAYLKAFFQVGVARFLPRPETEEDPSFKQIIPYCLFYCNGKLLVYVRGGKGGEKRLHAKYSLGIGGHINPIDTDGGVYDLNSYENAVQRELTEELVINAKVLSRKIVGLINDDSNSVGQVHLGVVELFELDSMDVSSNEDSIEGLKFLPVEELIDAIQDPKTSTFSLENWSEIVIRNISTILFREQ